MLSAFSLLCLAVINDEAVIRDDLTAAQPECCRECRLATARRPDKHDRSQPRDVDGTGVKHEVAGSAERERQDLVEQQMLERRRQRVARPDDT